MNSRYTSGIAGIDLGFMVGTGAVARFSSNKRWLLLLLTGTDIGSLQLEPSPESPTSVTTAKQHTMKKTGRSNTAMER
jgi:hypothetical protein